MTRKPISTSARRAIWEAHSRKSAYNGEIIPWGELTVDHIIPVTDPVHLARAIKLGIVDSTFDANGFENLLPAHSHHNSRKSDTDWQEATLRFFLELARAAKPKVEARIASELRSNATLKAYLDLKVVAERNEVSVDDLFQYVRHEADGEVPLRIVPGVDGADIASANSSVASSLMDRPLALGGGSIIEFDLRSDVAGSITVRTANEYLAAKERGYYPFTTFEIKAASMAEETAQLLKAVRDSRYAKRSEIREPLLTLNHLDRWHAEWATEAVYEPDERSKLRDFRTISDLVQAGICEIEAQNQWDLRFRLDRGFSVVMREVLRADLDADEEEEILMSHYLYAPGGTFGAGTVVMAKMNNEGLLRRVALR